ncbi:phenylacetic acid degradation operon negative regulatory protein [Micromonospora phaseoli]|uniref:Phenylacetic acid degradation operon negative regulatory protein n=1 Tax=Micromonospora phaseoli TaxID=1144548 RepID=A0A1H6UVU0_9ACTN|nr:PaaX family transcriptional regulator C-terminal domain-containing protein [Micromonospora phaseoli]PZV99033.1 PaaX family transcriptional regulator [Micromonospora phaseoli]GIJ76213.1 PaaX family transcriptional regulator [Micromonospora phaseoli]SEI92185.1 phenylacetic acid degradation operon negative regulatory protein [Micromonospora phaseoli]
MRSRQPKQLLLAFFGEHVADAATGPIRASALIGVLEGAGVAAPATRATLDRLVQSGILARSKSGREILFSLTGHGTAVLREATDRVRGPRPFDPQGTGWTLVTFSIPEGQRTLRHRLRSTLTWEGFVPLRDGLWLAPGEVDLAGSLEPLRQDFPPNAVVAFHARELAGFPIGDSVRAAWDIEAIRREHLAFIETWDDPAAVALAPSALTVRTMLVADWLALLRADPRLPPEFMGTRWPAARSTEVYRRMHERLAEDSAAEFAALVTDRGVARRRTGLEGLPSAPSPTQSVATRPR